MKEKITYIAFDGEEFETKEECEEYENKRSVKAYQEQVTILDEDGKEIPEWWEDDDGSTFFGVYFQTEEAREAFENYFSDYMPWDGNCYIPQVDGEVKIVGTHWVYLEDEWHCLEKDLELAQNRYNEWIKYFK